MGATASQRSAALPRGVKPVVKLSGSTTRSARDSRTQASIHPSAFSRLARTSIDSRENWTAAPIIRRMKQPPREVAFL